MSLLAPDLLAQEAPDVEHLRGETLPGEQFLHAGHAQGVPMILIDGAHPVLANFVHIEKAEAQAAPRDPANLSDSGLHPFQRQMFKQVVRKAKIERLVRRGNFKDIANLEANTCEKRPGVLNIIQAEVEAGVVQ